MRLFLTILSPLFGYYLSPTILSYVKTFDLITTMISFIVFFSYGRVLNHLLRLFKVSNDKNELTLNSSRNYICKYIMSVVSISFIVSAIIEMFSSERVLNCIYNGIYATEILSILLKIGFSTFVMMKIVINRLHYE